MENRFANFRVNLNLLLDDSDETRVRVMADFKSTQVATTLEGIDCGAAGAQRNLRN
jgi:hypothetical protein